jgi:hypothetical protein
MHNIQMYTILSNSWYVPEGSNHLEPTKSAWSDGAMQSYRRPSAAGHEGKGLLMERCAAGLRHFAPNYPQTRICMEEALDPHVSSAVEQHRGGITIELFTQPP